MPPNEVRTHVPLRKDAPCTRPIERFGDVVPHPILGGLHHRYARIIVRDFRGQLRRANALPVVPACPGAVREGVQIHDSVSAPSPVTLRDFLCPGTLTAEGVGERGVIGFAKKVPVPLQGSEHIAQVG
jgi:hypothetical protein